MQPHSTSGIKRILALGFVISTHLMTGPSQAQDDYFQQFVHYTIKARLDTKSHKLTGTETIRYVNNSPDTLRNFYLHLYPNAYKSTNTAFVKDFQRAFNFSLFDLPKKHRSYLNISDVSVDGRPVNPEINETIAMFDLPSPLLPGDSIEVSLKFDEKVRKHIGRAGYRGEHYDFAQWYPKVVVYDKDGFHPDVFRAGEFYGEFGKFDVYLEVPEHYVVAATGVLKDGDPGWTLNTLEGKGKAREKGDVAYKTVHFYAENVHDFAWNADPTFVVQDTTWNDIQIKSFFRKHNKAWKDTTLAHALRTMQWLSDRVGPYPYPQVSVVDALLRGGMEYPMLVMDGRVSETLVMHEIGHIYFYGILANDEREEAWMDEGFATFLTGWYQIQRYGEYGITRDWNLYQRITPQYTVLENARRNLFEVVRPGYGERVATRSEDFKNSYREMVYRKPALVLFALRYVVGEENFDRILKQYYETWKLKHVNEERFQAVCEEVSGMDLSWFFEEWLHTRKICDYRLSDAKVEPSESGDAYVVRVKIERRGEVIMPLALEFTFADGSKETVRVEGRLRTIKHTYEFPERPKSVALNPANEIIDINMADNFLPRRWNFQIDWPNNFYYPEDAYQIRYSPFIWYNDFDQLRLGLRLKGSQVDWYRRLGLGVYYGTNSERLDFSASYARPLRLFGNNATLTLSGYKMEGRQDFTLSLDVNRREELIRPPTHRLRAAFNYHQLTDERYVANVEETYETLPNVVPLELGYRVDPQLDVLQTSFDARLRLGRRWLGGKHKYSRFTSTVALKTRPRFVPFDAGLRIFLGIVGGRMPVQEKLNLAGAGTLERERSLFVRSDGAIWPELNYLVPGDGNLRGYAEGTFAVNRLLTVNFEVGGSIPWISKKLDRWLGTIKVMAFADAGTIFDNENPIGASARVQDLVDDGILDRGLFDAGVGFRVRRNLWVHDLDLRFDIPFYVNQPQINGERDETKYRYLLSLTSMF